MQDPAPTSAAEQSAHGTVPIAEVSRQLGIPLPTLRSWEIRYGIPPISRESGRHRRYSADDLHMIRLLRDEINRGQQAAKAARTVHELLSAEGEIALAVARVLKASAEMSPAGLREAFDLAADALGLASCIDDVILPSMRQVGTWWETGRCDVDQERLTTETARTWLDRRSALAPPPTFTRPVLLACGPSDLHTIGLESLALLLREQGRPCRVLGARIRPEVLVDATRAADAAAVVLVSHLATGRRRAIAVLDRIHDLGVPTFYAGNAFLSTRSRQGVPGQYLGNHLTTAADTVVAALAKDRRRK